ncbi:thioesterase II family protein [Aquimarina algiphila]|uniref:thioesterase II family protein n=1 Tax=Aquimarina algiphila TaxID=2047982 RepID=UPI00248FCF5C|nr:thioesterase domain-containing protein [Aquimarina algiphila]
MSNIFLKGAKENQGDKSKIFFFPHSGSGPGLYMNWGKYLEGFEVIGVQYPGRGSRIAEEFSKTLEELVTSIFNSLDWKSISGNFFFFGHSLGALIAYELAKKIEKNNLPTPKSIIISALPSPISNSYKDRVKIVDEVELIDMMYSLSEELAEEFTKDEDLIALYVEIVNADIALLGTHTPSANDTLDTDIHVFGGTEDSIAINALETWQEHTLSNFSLHLFNGGHFYYQKNFDAFINTLKTILK